MYKVNQTTKDAYKSDASHKELVVRIPSANITLRNEDILADSLELKEAIESGLAFEKMKEWIKAQGGNVNVLENTNLLPSAKSFEITL